MKKKKTQKYQTEEQMEIKKFIFVLLGLIIIIIGIYFFTRAFVTKDLFKETENINYTEGKISYEAVVVGTMLNRTISEYYVLAFSNKDNNAVYYNTLASKYMNLEKAKKLYYLDLDNKLNKPYVSTDENYSTSFTSLEELKFGGFTLLKIKEGKVIKYITDLEKIKIELGI